MNKGDSLKERLLLEAFKCFLANNYDKVSLKDIEVAGEFTRGVTYYYTRGKFDLFCQVMDEFVLKKLDIKNKMTLVEGVSLHDFIQQQIQGIQRTMDKLFELTGSNSNSYMFLIYQASKSYPGFNEKYTKNGEAELNVWKEVIKNAVLQNEIVNVDIETTATMFRSLHLGMAYDQSFTTGLQTEQLRHLFLSLYNQIKKN